MAIKYVQPQVVEYGRIEKLTLGIGGAGVDTFGGVFVNNECLNTDPVTGLLCSV